MSETRSMTITEFLLARVNEEEIQARAAIATVAPDAWENPTSWGNFFPEDIAFWDNHTPYRILAECAAKRAIIDLHPVYVDEDPGFYLEVSGHPCRTPRGMGEVIPCHTLRALAAVYKDHPDYQQEWALCPARTSPPTTTRTGARHE